MEKLNSFTCPICQGTGFSHGQICICITGLKTGEKDTPDMPEFMKDLFGGFDGKCSHTKGRP
jgi:hypothetical protein